MLKKLMLLCASVLITSSICAYADEDPAVIDASKHENGLLLYSPDDPKGWQTVLSSFEAKYPWIKVEYVQLGAAELWERFNAESASGVKTADIMISSGPDEFVVASDKGQLLNYTPADADQLEKLGQAPLPGVTAVGVDSRTLIWNKLKLPQDLWPTGFLDLADKVAAHPDVFAGKIVTFDPISSSVGPGFSIALEEGLGDKYWDALKKLGPALRFESGGSAMLDKVTSGEALVGYLIAARIPRLSITGARAKVVGWTYDENGPIQINAMAIPAKSADVNSAKLFADYLCSPEGQQVYGTTFNNPLHPGVVDNDKVVSYKTVASHLKTTSVYGFGRKILTFNKDYAPKINAAIGRQ